jgi:hypothetical protein
MKMPEPQCFDQSHLGMPGVEAGEFLLINLTMSNLMEVDSDTSPSQLLGSAFTPTPPAVPSLQDKINLTMNDINWTIKMKRDNPKEVFGLMIIIILLANAASSGTNFIDIPTSACAAEKLIEGLDEKGLEEWQDGVNAGIETGGWAGLASHCTFWKLPIWTSGLIFLFTAILRKSAKNIEFLN